jgi:XRE family transcriptional regulator, aerobic/anaerobic benzoate catabolism transcriptional regulator
MCTAVPNPGLDMFATELGKRLKNIRQEKGYSQEELCLITGISRRFLGQVERGQANVSLSRLHELSQGLKISLVTMLVGLSPISDSLDSIAGRISALPDDQRKTFMNRIGAGSPKVALIGLRGSGKTAIGERAANRLNWTFVQADRRLRDKLGMSLADIFEHYGPDRYRELSRSVLVDILQEPTPMVLEVGGSIVLDPVCFSSLQIGTTLIWLFSSPEEHLRRVKAQGDTRVTKGFDNALEEIRSLLRIRMPFYEKSHFVFHTGKLGISGSVDAICKVAKESS